MNWRTNNEHNGNVRHCIAMCQIRNITFNPHKTIGRVGIHPWDKEKTNSINTTHTDHTVSSYMHSLKGFVALEYTITLSPSVLIHIFFDSHTHRKQTIVDSSKLLQNVSPLLLSGQISCCVNLHI